jgi:hypothetical protein
MLMNSIKFVRAQKMPEKSRGKPKARARGRASEHASRCGAGFEAQAALKSPPNARAPAWGKSALLVMLAMHLFGA